VTVVGLVVVLLALHQSANPYLDNVYYPYSVGCMALAGLALERLGGVIAVPTLTATVYAAATVWRFELQTGLLMNMATYWVLPVVGWALARTIRSLARRLDAAHEQEKRLIRERESAQHKAQRRKERDKIFAELHNHVLQDLEFLAREHVLNDQRAQQRLAADAAWLRSLLADSEDNGPHHLVPALAEAVRRQEERGLRVELNIAGLAGLPDVLPAPEVVRVVADAVYEALNNVRAHADVDRAFVRSEIRDETVVVTVVDRGRGFDTLAVTRGYGLRIMLDERVRQAGGDVTITSEPGEGTRVQIRIPARLAERGPDYGLPREPGT